MRSATGNNQKEVLSPNIQQNKNTANLSTKTSWKVDKLTQELRQKFYRAVDKHG